MSMKIITDNLCHDMYFSERKSRMMVSVVNEGLSRLVTIGSVAERGDCSKQSNALRHETGESIISPIGVPR